MVCGVDSVAGSGIGLFQLCAETLMLEPNARAVIKTNDLIPLWWVTVFSCSYVLFLRIYSNRLDDLGSFGPVVLKDVVVVASDAGINTACYVDLFCKLFEVTFYIADSRSRATGSNSQLTTSGNGVSRLELSDVFCSSSPFFAEKLLPLLITHGCATCHKQQDACGTTSLEEL